MGERRAPGRPDSKTVAHRAALSLRRLLPAGLTLAAAGSAAHAAGLDSLGLRLGFDAAALTHPDHQGVLGLSLVGLVVFATTTAIVHVRGRHKWVAQDARQKARIAELSLEKERADLILASEQQILVTWSGREAEPEIIGDVLGVLGLAIPRRLLGFGSWLPAPQAGALDHAVDRLKSQGEGFAMTVETTAGRYIDIKGLTFAGRALLRLRELTAERAALAELEDRFEALQREVAGLNGLLDAIPQPLWLRGADGRLSWVNAAYARAVEAASAAVAVEHGTELVDIATRTEAAQLRAAGAPFKGRTATVAGGDKLVFDIVDVALEHGSGGIATDITEREAIRLGLASQIENHVRTLHQLPAAVAIFDSAQRLQFYNEAYRALWQLDATFLAARPGDGEILDRLRSERRLPEQADFRGWKRAVLEGYHTLDTLENWWYLPDGRTLRVVTNPNPQGGVTYLFDDVTERFHLESRVNALSRVQGETLDTLKEAVAVFGSDGRLKLSNPAFARIWAIDPAKLAGNPHIDAVIACSGAAHAADPVWAAILKAVTGLQDAREPMTQRTERADGMVIDCATAPLPDGATLITFADVSDSVHAERMLKERNDALEAAGQIKNNFVQTVSYELRTPLQNITGFSEALAAGAAGPLTAPQAEYLSHIASSSETLKALVEDILDLANIDAGSVELDFDTVDVQASVDAAIAGLRERIESAHVEVAVRIDPSAARFVADGKRIRQVLFNLVKNAIGYSQAGQTVRVEARAEQGSVLLEVSDHGSGIPREIIEKVFERFETHTIGRANKGAGLGLAIVRSFVELHGGTVALDSVEGQGTTVTCRFPISGGEPARAAA